MHLLANTALAGLLTLLLATTCTSLAPVDSHRPPVSTFAAGQHTGRSSESQMPPPTHVQIEATDPAPSTALVDGPGVREDGRMEGLLDGGEKRPQSVTLEEVHKTNEERGRSDTVTLDEAKEPGKRRARSFTFDEAQEPEKKRARASEPLVPIASFGAESTTPAYNFWDEITIADEVTEQFDATAEIGADMNPDVDHVPIKRLLSKVVYIPSPKANAMPRKTRDYKLYRGKSSEMIYEEYVAGRNGQPALGSVIRDKSLYLDMKGYSGPFTAAVNGWKMEFQSPMDFNHRWMVAMIIQKQFKDGTEDARKIISRLDRSIRRFGLYDAAMEGLSWDEETLAKLYSDYYL